MHRLLAAWLISVDVGCVSMDSTSALAKCRPLPSARQQLTWQLRMQRASVVRLYEVPRLGPCALVHPELGVVQAGGSELLLQAVDLVLVLHAVGLGLLQVLLVRCALLVCGLQLLPQAVHLSHQPLQGRQAEGCTQQDVSTAEAHTPQHPHPASPEPSACTASLWPVGLALPCSSSLRTS